MHEPPPKDSQEHILGCNMIQLEDTSIANDKIEYGDLFADVLRQKEAVTLYTMLIEERERILSSEEPNPPGDNLDPSNGRSCCYSSALFTSQRLFLLSLLSYKTVTVDCRLSSAGEFDFLNQNVTI